MNIPLINLERQQAAIKDQIDRNISRVLAHGQFILGPEVTQLEDRLAAFAKVTHVIGCSSGTDALLLGLMAQGVGPGQAVFTSAFSFVAAAEAITRLGATVVFVDIEPATLTMDPEKLEQAINLVLEDGALTPSGIIPVDIFGLPADYERINALAHQHGLFVLEDAAQSIGASYHDKPTGSLTDIAATSFFPTKPLGAYGDGGAVLTNDDDLAATIRSLHNHGRSEKVAGHTRIGLNARLDTIQAAILLAKLDIFEQERVQRQAIADQYTHALTGLVETPACPADRTSAWAQYSIMTDQRDRLQAALAKRGIGTAIYYPQPLPLQPAFAASKQEGIDFPVAHLASTRILSLPMHPYITSEEILYIQDVITRVLR